MPGMARGLGGKVRRFWLTHFRRRYVRAKAAQRRGACRRCGNCCRIVFKCPWLRRGNHCAIYAARAAQCRAFPIDERDLRDVPACGFSFEGTGRGPAGTSPGTPARG
jgi:hypothetical protein